MPQIKSNGLMLEYEIHGDSGEPMLMIMGAAGQLILWPEKMIQNMVDRGFKGIVYDHRDVGLSEKMVNGGFPDVEALKAAQKKGETGGVPYDLSDLAADAVGLLDALGIERAHIVGVSMGGMIAQLVAADYPDRTLSLASLMSTTGAPKLPGPDAETLAKLEDRGPDPREDFEGYLQTSVRFKRINGSPGYPQSEEAIRNEAARLYERCFYPEGFLRHYAAVLASPDRTAKLKNVTAPSIVIHGENDVLMPVAAAHATAEAIPGARLKVYPGMGHDLPAELLDGICDEIASTAVQAKSAA